MSPARRRQFAILLALMLAGAVAELATIGSVIPFLSLLADGADWDRIAPLGIALEAVGDSRFERLAAATGLLIVLVLAASVIRLRLSWAIQHFVFGLGHDLSVEIQRRILLQPYSFHVARNSSGLVAAFEKVQALVGILQHLISAAIAGFIAFVILAGLVWLDPFSALVAAAAFGLIYVLVSALARGRLARNSATIAASYDERIKIVQESLGGVRDVIVDGSHDAYVGMFRKVDGRFNRAQADIAAIGASPRFVIEALGTVLIALLALWISGREGDLSEALPVLGALALGAQRLLPLLQQMYSGWSFTSGHGALVAQVLSLLRLPISSDRQRQAALPALEMKDRIRLDDLSFTYPGQGAPALENVTFDIKRGSRVALVGRTGSGKSTLADLLMGLLEPQAGGILVDGIALTGETRRRWQRSIAHVPQAIFIADTSIARNIAFSDQTRALDMDRIIEAAKIAQLHDFIETLPDSYRTRVGERGVRLSGGQRQRLGLARAVYKGAPLLVLDEATSALDEETEAAVLQALDRLSEDGRTIVMIAHRQSTVASCDTVIRLQKGRVAAVGSSLHPSGNASATKASR